MRISTLICALFCAVLTTNAQNAKSILDKANEAFNRAGGITATFTLRSEDSNKKVTYSQDGTIFIKGDKFKIDVPDAITWFNGKTQWSYIKGSDEVNITNPTGDELAGISPSVLLNIYKKGFKLNTKDQKVENGKTVFVVELIPESKTAEFSKILISIDKSTYLFSSIILFGNNGMKNNLQIKKIQTKVPLADNTFVFDKAKYQGVELIDLR